ncbi:MAG: TolC family protein [Eubacteriales bacterium]|nr:TolC family protein [Eubacteriales bacterium]
MKNKLIKIVSVSLVAALACSSLTYARNPRFSRSEEEWARLEDDLLEWDEIDGLADEYNPEILDNEYAYKNDENRSKNAEEIANSMMRLADNYEQKAYETEDTSGLTAASYLSQADSLRSQAADSVSDSETIRLNYFKANEEVKKSVRTKFIDYYRAIASRDSHNAQVAYLKSNYESVKNKRAAGTATYLEEISALESYQKALISTNTMEANVRNAYRNLIVSCGWQYYGEPQIGPMPQIDVATVMNIDQAADLEKCLAQSYTLQIDNILLKNAKQYHADTDVEVKYTRTLNNDTNTVKTKYQSAYDSLAYAKASYDAEVASCRVSEQNLEKAKNQLKNGTISQIEYKAAENTVNSSRSAITSAYYDLVAARVDYDAVVNGLT